MITYTDKILTKKFKTLSVSEFNEFKSRLKSAENLFQLSVSLTLKPIYTILRGTNHI